MALCPQTSVLLVLTHFVHMGSFLLVPWYRYPGCLQTASFSGWPTAGCQWCSLLLPGGFLGVRGPAAPPTWGWVVGPHGVWCLSPARPPSAFLCSFSVFVRNRSHFFAPLLQAQPSSQKNMRPCGRTGATFSRLPSRWTATGRS